MQPVDITDITDYLAISPTLASAGQPTSEQLAAVQAAGYEVIINLAPNEPRALADEAELVHALGLDYIHIPVLWQAPTAADLDAFLAAMARTAHRKRFVHCIANRRVSAFLFLHRVLVEGMTPAAAQGLLDQIWQPNPIWAAFIQDELRKRNIEWRSGEGS